MVNVLKGLEYEGKQILIGSYLEVITRSNCKIIGELNEVYTSEG